MPLEQLEPELDPSFDDPASPTPALTHPLRRPRRRDGMALAFGVAFIVFGVLGLVRAFGVHVPSAWIYPVVLIGLGAAGLVSSFSREVR